MTVIFIFIFAALYAIKGGWHKPLRHLYARAIGIPFTVDGKPDPQGAWQYSTYQLMDGKILSAILCGLAMGCLVSGAAGLWLVLIAPLAWLAGVGPSMGEEADSVGGYRGGKAYGGFDREYGIKKSIQRGVFTTAPMVVVLSILVPVNPAPLLIAGAMFPVAYFVGISIYQFQHKTTATGWAYAEPIYGALIGLGLAYAI